MCFSFRKNILTDNMFALCYSDWLKIKTQHSAFPETSSLEKSITIFFLLKISSFIDVLRRYFSVIVNELIINVIFISEISYTYMHTFWDGSGNLLCQRKRKTESSNVAMKRINLDCTTTFIWRNDFNHRF